MSTKTRKYKQKARAEGQKETRAKIAAAAAGLHAEVGPAATTVAEIARRAGVSRLTVYNHFPDNAALLPACSAHWLAGHPLPDFAPALAAGDPRERVCAVAGLLYSKVYRAWGPMMRNLQRDRNLDPQLDAFMVSRTDVLVDGLASEIADGFGARGAKAARVRSLARLALDFWTWHRLDAEGLDDEGAAQLMADAVGAVAA